MEAVLNNELKLNIKYKSIRLNSVLIFLFLFASIFTPYDNFNVKKIFLIVLLIINLKLFISCVGKYKIYNLIYIFTFILLPLACIFSLIRGISILNIISSGYSGLIFLLFIIIKERKIDFSKMLLFYLKVLAVFVFVCYLLDIFQILDIYDNSLLMWFHNSENAMIGKSNDFVFKYVIFFKTSPLLLYLVYKSIAKKRYVMFVISTIATFASGTRANVFILALFLFLYFFFVEKDHMVKILFLLIFILLGIVLSPILIPFLMNAFKLKASSDAVRGGHLTSIFEIFRNNFLYLFGGMGIGSEFYSKGVSQYVIDIELSYWNLLRQFGVIGFISFMLIPILAIVMLWRRRNYGIMLVLCAFLVISYTNPFLYSSTGITLIVCVMNDSYVKDKIKCTNIARSNKLYFQRR